MLQQKHAPTIQVNYMLHWVESLDTPAIHGFSEPRADKCKMRSVSELKISLFLQITF